MSAEKEIINLSEKNDDVKYNDPFGNIQFYPEGSENKTDQQEQNIYNDRTISQYHDRILQPGQLY